MKQETSGKSLDAAYTSLPDTLSQVNIKYYVTGTI